MSSPGLFEDAISPPQAPAAPPDLYTIGHSTRTFDEFTAMLSAFGVTRLVDVRTMPKSRRVPWTNSEELAAMLPAREISYMHMPKLGGLRHARKDSPNAGWKNAGFRGYADYMATADFERGIQELLKAMEDNMVAIMCAEAVPWKCHRSMVADALTARGFVVRHITGPHSAFDHKMTKFAVVDTAAQPPTIGYPAAAE